MYAKVCIPLTTICSSDVFQRHSIWIRKQTSIQVQTQEEIHRDPRGTASAAAGKNRKWNCFSPGGNTWGGIDPKRLRRSRYNTSLFDFSKLSRTLHCLQRNLLKFGSGRAICRDVVKYFGLLLGRYHSSST